MNRLADFVLMYRPKIEQAIEEIRFDCCQNKTGGGSSGKAFISDPTAQKAIKNVMPVGTIVIPYGPNVAGKRDVMILQKPEKWLTVIDITWRHFTGKPHMDVMRLRYQKNCTNMRQVAYTTHLSMQRCYVLLDDVHRFAINYAKGIGAYQVKSKQPKRLAEIIRATGGKEDAICKKNATETQKSDINP